MTLRHWLLLPVLALAVSSSAVPPATPGATPLAAAATPEIVRSVPGTPPPLHPPDPRPGEKCYFWDQDAGLLIVGKVGNHGEFIPDEPRKTLNYNKNGFAVSLHFPFYQESRYRSHGPPTWEKLGIKRPTLRALGMTPPPAGWKHVQTYPSGDVEDQTYDPKTDTILGVLRPKSVPGAIPGHKYYKFEYDTLILGTVDNTGAFIPDEPRQEIDVSNQWPTSLPYPYLPGTTTGWKRYSTDKDGNQIVETYDLNSGTFQSRIVPKK
ncbi:hypothetical protein CfE428DRAFT_6491 [Chthoniobacter flavus Ellin428]|uniref:Uncharacterized protein n=1 Tax=Chthoniobacter flavus Ellin428 TaxID=497964 RepID=B4DC50_9BACT|nr:hypothetical protein [Chthoniobacter flavus]EDY15972.1 hypothetical protein CfE428DRAFT_6491 [Chthoniobacter flavus Ellin428]TCO83286.1 hypothetical protein EV701_1426 [Chthoniobacter flavus]